MDQTRRRQLETDVARLNNEVIAVTNAWLLAYGHARGMGLELNSPVGVLSATILACCSTNNANDDML
jgi:hypothetical protein